MLYNFCLSIETWWGPVFLVWVFPLLLLEWWQLENLKNNLPQRSRSFSREWWNYEWCFQLVKFSHVITHTLYFQKCCTIGLHYKSISLKTFLCKSNFLYISYSFTLLANLAISVRHICQQGKFRGKGQILSYCWYEQKQHSKVHNYFSHIL